MLLAHLVEEHRRSPFPDSVERGVDYGLIDPVMSDADVFGWASTVAAGTALDTESHSGLARLATDMLASLPLIPLGARPYFERLLALAVLALRPDRTVWLCPVCSFPGLRAPPYENWPPRAEGLGPPPYEDTLGRPSYEVCPMCGFEFGNDDNPGAAAPMSFDAFREDWQAQGRPILGGGRHIELG